MGNSNGEGPTMSLGSTLRNRHLASKAIMPFAALVICGALTGAAAARPGEAPKNAGVTHGAQGALPVITSPSSTASCPRCGVDKLKVGDTLTSSTGTWPQNPAPTSFAYQWERCGTDGTG